MSFAALADWLRAGLNIGRAGLPPMQGEALLVALGRKAGLDQPPPPGTIGLGLLGVLDQLAARSAVLVAIDDVQWLDPPSARVLGFSLRRLARQPVAVLATERTDRAPGRDLDLDRVMPDRCCPSLTLGGLTLGPLHPLLPYPSGGAFAPPPL